MRCAARRRARRWPCCRAGSSAGWFGDQLLVGGLSFSLPPNGIVGVIGPNGVGKLTR